MKEKQYGLRKLNAGQEFILPRYQLQVPGNTKRATAQRVVLSSSTTETQKSIETSASGQPEAPDSSLAVGEKGGSRQERTPSIEIPETQGRRQRNVRSVPEAISSLNQTRRKLFQQSDTNIESIPRATSKDISPIPESTSPIRSPTIAFIDSNSASYSTANSSSRDTVPDSQPDRNLTSFARSSPVPLFPHSTIRQSETERQLHQSEHVHLSVVSNLGSQVFEDQDLLQTSPVTSSAGSRLFEGSRSTQEGSISSGIESDSELLRFSQGHSQDQSQSQSLSVATSNPAPSTQLEIIPSIEEDIEVSEAFQTQVPQQYSVSQLTSQSQVETSGVSEPTQTQHQRSPRRRNSMAGTSRESTPLSNRIGPAESQSDRQTGQEILVNMRSPANTLEETPTQNVAPNPPVSQAEVLIDKREVYKPAESHSIVQTTEQFVPTKVDVLQSGNGTDSDGLAGTPAIVEAGSHVLTSSNKLGGLDLGEKRPVMMPLLGPSEYVVPLPVEGKMRDQYLELIKSKENDITRFLQNEREPSAGIVRCMELLVERLGLITAHTDYLIEDALTQINVTAAQEATWADYASTKFAFLGYLLDLLRPQTKHILLVAESQRVRDGLATYCRGKKIRHTHYDEPTSSANSDDEIEGLVDVVIRSSYTNGSASQAPPADLTIVFDSSAARIVHEPRNVVGPPVVHLVVKNSPEHAALCLPKNLPQNERLRIIVREVVASKHSLGKVDFGTEAELAHYQDYTERTQAIKKDFNIKIMMVAKAVAHCLSEEDFDSAWPLPLVRFDTVDKFELPAIPPIRPASPIRSRTGTPLGQKRTLDAMDSSGTKRQRLTPLQDVTHISDSLKDSQSQVDAMREELRKAQQALAQERIERANETQSLRSALSAAEEKAQEMTIELRKLQHRYETRSKEFHTMRRTITKHDEEKTAEAVRRTKLLGEVESLQQQRRALQEELTAARTTIKEGGGTTGELEVAREQVRRLEKEKTSLEKSNANMKKDFEFTRQQYQNASTAAVEAASQVTDLEAEIATLKVAASDEKRKLKETNFSNDRERYLAHIAQLEATVASRDYVLQRKEEELKIKRGRGVQTRSNSVQPSSPRLTAGIAPGSRGSSPVPGLLSVGRMSALRHER